MLSRLEMSDLERRSRYRWVLDSDQLIVQPSFGALFGEIKMKILLIGYYGKHNIGDDLFVHQLSRLLSQQSSVEQVTFLCDSLSYHFEHPKIRYCSTQRLNRLQRLALIAKHDVIAWGGGTLAIHDKPLSLLRMQSAARYLRKPFYFLGVGLDGISEGQQQLGLQVFKNATAILARDQISFQYAQNLDPSQSRTYLGGDLAFLDLSLYRPFIQRRGKERLAEPDTQPFRHVSVTGKFWWGGGRAEFYAAQLLPLMEKYGTHIHLLPAQQQAGELNDNHFHQRLLKHLPADQVTIYEDLSPLDYIDRLSRMDFHVGNRLHSVILAEILGVPSIGIDESGKKIDNFIQKTEVLTDLRRVSFMQEIPLATFEKIHREYRHPIQFVQSESRMARQGLATLLQLEIQHQSFEDLGAMVLDEATVSTEQKHGDLAAPQELDRGAADDEVTDTAMAVGPHQ